MTPRHSTKVCQKPPLCRKARTTTVASSWQERKRFHHGMICPWLLRREMGDPKYLQNCRPCSQWNYRYILQGFSWDAYLWHLKRSMWLPGACCTRRRANISWWLRSLNIQSQRWKLLRRTPLSIVAFFVVVWSASILPLSMSIQEHPNIQ